MQKPMQPTFFGATFGSDCKYANAPVRSVIACWRFMFMTSLRASSGSVANAP